MTDAPPSVGRTLREDVAWRVKSLQDAYLGHRGPAAQAHAQGNLALIRICDPADPLGCPRAWAVIQEATPESLSRAPWGQSTDEPTPAERARHCAMVLYAIHQQGQNQPANLPGRPFAQAVRQLSDIQKKADNEFDATTKRRFDQVMLAPTWTGRASHMTALVRMIRTENVAFDHARLAYDLFRLADPNSAPSVRLAWGRDFYRTSDSSTPPSTSDTGELK